MSKQKSFVCGALPNKMQASSRNYALDFVVSFGVLPPPIAIKQHSAIEVFFSVCPFLSFGDEERTLDDSVWVAPSWLEHDRLNIEEATLFYEMMQETPVGLFALSLTPEKDAAAL